MNFKVSQSSIKIVFVCDIQKEIFMQVEENCKFRRKKRELVTFITIVGGMNILKMYTVFCNYLRKEH